ncbi:MAG TPA: DNA methyltransferase [Planctomycetota bacterium]|nr:DNA methyltransferase [Planctomycetota bacterium]
MDDDQESARSMGPVAEMRVRPSALVDTRVIYCGDNLERLKSLPDRCVDLIYIDPPFNSNRNYEVFWGETREKRAFADRHASTQAYIQYMRPRCVQLERVLKRSGSFYYHCDWHASHYVKVMLDGVFGENNFQTEIIWRRNMSKGLSYNGFPNNHDTIFYYGNGNLSAMTFNRPYIPYDMENLSQKTQSKYSHVDSKGRHYQLDNLINPSSNRPNLTYEFLGIKRVWRWTKERMIEAYKKGMVIQTKPGAVPRFKRYLDEQEGLPIDSVWTDIPPLNSQAAERLGYPTQKPLALLERIVKASSTKNDIVLDAFCGCGTALVAAQNLKRQWIGIDISPTACRVMAKRLRDVCYLPEDEKDWRRGRGFVVRNLPWSIERLRAIPAFEFENWAVNELGGVANKVQVGDFGIDGRIYPVSSMPKKRGAETGELEIFDEWYPIQVKQKDQAGRPDIDAFETAMRRADRKLGYFVAFDFTKSALDEIDRFERAEGRRIKAYSVQALLDMDTSTEKSRTSS